MGSKPLAVFWIVLAILTLLLAGCPSPEEGSASKQGTVKGRIYNSVTGAGISGAKVCLDTLTTTTDGAGNYSFDWQEEGDALGFCVWKDLNWSFALFDRVSIDASSNPELNFSLTPFDTNSYPSYTLAGTLPTAVSGNGGIFIRVRNSTGGTSESMVDLGNGATTYTATVKTGGSNCIVVVFFDYNIGDGNTTTCQYLQNQNLVAGSNTLNIGTASGSVTLNGGVAGEMVQSELQTSSYGNVGFGPLGDGGNLIFTGATIAAPFSNPENFPVIWTVLQSETKAAGTFNRVSYSARIPQSTTVTLPALPSSTNDPDGGGTVYCTPASRQLYFTIVNGANLYSVSLTDNTGHKGQVLTNQSYLTVPIQLYEDVLDPAEGWDASQSPIWCSSPDLSTFICPWSNNGPTGLANLQFIGAPNTDTADVIP